MPPIRAKKEQPPKETCLWNKTTSSCNIKGRNLNYLDNLKCKIIMNTHLIVRHQRHDIHVIINIAKSITLLTVACLDLKPGYWQDSNKHVNLIYIVYKVSQGLRLQTAIPISEVHLTRG